MLNSVEGIYRNGKIELLETPAGIEEGRVIVTFLSTKKIDLTTRGIDEKQAADLRHRLQTIAEDWEHPDMEIYDAL